MTDSIFALGLLTAIGIVIIVFLYFYLRSGRNISHKENDDDEFLGI